MVLTNSRLYKLLLRLFFPKPYPSQLPSKELKLACQDATTYGRTSLSRVD